MESEEGRVAEPAATDEVVDDGVQAAEAEAEPTPSSDETGIEAPFSIDDVPDEYRPHVTALDRSYKAEFTRKTQELAAERERINEYAELLSRLEDPEDGAQALSELAERFGFEEVGEAEDEPEGEAGVEDETLAGVDERLAKRIEELEAAHKTRAEQEKEAAKARQVQTLREHVESGLSELRGREGGLSKDGEEMFVYAALQNPGRNGLPNLELAKAKIEAVEAAAVKRYVEARKKESTAPSPGGSSGVSRPDTSTAKARRSLGEQIAERHYAQG